MWSKVNNNQSIEIKSREIYVNKVNLLNGESLLKFSFYMIKYGDR